MNFYQWLQSLDPKTTWDYKSIGVLEKQVIGVVRETGSLNLQEIYSQFWANDDPGFPTTKKDGAHFIKA